MAEFKINGRMNVKTLKELFFNEFEGTLRVYDGKKLADDEATLASIRSNEGAKGGELSYRASHTVGKFEQEIWDVFGIKVQVATKDNWVLVLDGITLSKIKDIPKYATKEVMEEFLSYKCNAKNNEQIELKKYIIQVYGEYADFEVVSEDGEDSEHIAYELSEIYSITVFDEDGNEIATIDSIIDYDEYYDYEKNSELIEAMDDLKDKDTNINIDENYVGLYLNQEKASCEYVIETNKDFDVNKLHSGLREFVFEMSDESYYADKTLCLFYDGQLLKIVDILNSYNKGRIHVLGEDPYDENSGYDDEDDDNLIDIPGDDDEDDDEEIIDGIKYRLDWYSTAWVIGDEDYSGDIVIPETIVAKDGVSYKVIGIEEYAFEDCEFLTSINIPDSVTSIGVGAFWKCRSLSSINIPNGLTTIGNGAFADCESLTSINIPDGVIVIGESAFWGCSSLTAINIPDSVTSIGVGAFWGTSIIVGKNNKVYDSRDNCNAIIETATNTLIRGCQNTIIPDGVTSIGEGAFCAYLFLTSITIPNGVTSIGKQAFAGCKSLADIRYNGTIEQWQEIKLGNYWNEEVPSTVVHCTDGDVEI